jgi:hypothetical protein
VPILLTNLHHVLYETKYLVPGYVFVLFCGTNLIVDRNLEKSLHLAALVADEERGLYKLFGDKLFAFLERLRTSAVAMHHK